MSKSATSGPWPIAAEHDLEDFTSGCLSAFYGLLNGCESDGAFHAAAKALGQWLKEDGDWRRELKTTLGDNGDKSEWVTLTKFCNENKQTKTGAWWKILDYADSIEVSEDVQNFFDPVKA